MASRIQSKILGLGLDAQTDISVPSQSFLRFRQLNAEITPVGYLTENDAAEIGKGNEFISSTGVYPVSWSPLARIDKYSSAEFMCWAWAYALGGVSEAAGVYTIVPLDPCIDGIQGPLFSVVEQVCDSGGMAVDNAYVGCAVEDVTYEFNYGPGRQSGKCTVNWVGSGIIDSPSGVVVPPSTDENYMLSAGMQLNINGVDYVTAKTVLSGTLAWKNNLLVGPGFYPGSGLQEGAAVRGRLEFGPRASTFTFTARLLKNSVEYQLLISATTGTATLTVQFDATHNMTFNYPSIQYETVVNGEQDGIVSVTVTVATKWDPTNGLVTITSQCGITGIAQVITPTVPAISPTSQNILAGGGSGNAFQVISAGSVSPWTAATTDAWITIDSPSGPTTGDATVTFSVDPQGTGDPARVGTITISGFALTFTVNQAAG
ncbi:MAG TPA: BACON domain-containing protein [Terriglobales bacterium]